jgi:hypothetical protein
LKLFTSSLAKSARSCRRKYRLSYVDGVKPAESAHALRFGTLVHRGLEAWWLAKKAGEEQDRWLDLAIARSVGIDVDPVEASRARVMLTGYHLRWKDEAFEVLAVEAEFRGELLNPKTGKPSKTWELAGKIDVIVRDLETNLTLLIEHKTSSEDVSPGSDYVKRLKMDGQVSTYFEGGRLLGYEVSGCIYDILGKPKHDLKQVPALDEHGNKVVLDAQGERVRTAQGKWRQSADAGQGYVLQTREETLEEFTARIGEAVATAPDAYFARPLVVRLEAELRDALTDTWQLAQGLQTDEVQGRYPRNPDSCVQFGRTCPYFAICCGEASADDQRLFTRQAQVHSELSIEPTAAP